MFKPAVLSYAGNALGEAVIAPASCDARTISPNCYSEFEFELNPPPTVPICSAVADGYSDCGAAEFDWAPKPALRLLWVSLIMSFMMPLWGS